MKKKIIEIATELSKGKLTTKEAKDELLFLFNVVGQSIEQPKEVEDDKLKSLETEIVNMRRQLKGMRQKVQILRGF
jgi:hypothetical protein